jgi:predicted murein hydrolase (TIGR00659 family)
VKSLLATPLFLTTLTLAVYAAWAWLYGRTRRVYVNPVLLSVLVLIPLLRALRVDFRAYAAGTQAISFFLAPGVVALGVTLHDQLHAIRRLAGSLAVSLGVGSVVGVVTAVGIAKLLGASHAVTATLAPKSVTTPIAMAITERLGGIPPLAAAIVILVGIFGAIVGPAWLDLLRVKSPSARGLAMGAAAHVVGTARAMEDGPLVGAASAVAIGLNGAATAVVAPLLLRAIERAW